MDMTLNEPNLVTSSCWDEKFTYLTSDMTKYKHTSRYDLKLNSLLVPDANPLHHQYFSFDPFVNEQNAIGLATLSEQQIN